MGVFGLVTSWAWSFLGLAMVLSLGTAVAWLSANLRLVLKQQQRSKHRFLVGRLAKTRPAAAQKGPQQQHKNPHHPKNVKQHHAVLLSEEKPAEPVCCEKIARRKKVGRGLRKRAAARCLQRLCLSICARRSAAAVIIGRWLRGAWALQCARAAWQRAMLSRRTAAGAARTCAIAAAATPVQRRVSRRLSAKRQAASVVAGLYRMKLARRARRAAACSVGTKFATKRKERFERAVLLLQRAFASRRARHLVAGAEVIAAELANSRREQLKRDEKREKGRLKKQSKRDRKAAADAAKAAVEADERRAREALWARLWAVRVRAPLLGGDALFRRGARHDWLACRSTAKGAVFLYQASADHAWVVGDEAAREARERRGWLTADECPGSLPDRLFSRSGDVGECIPVSRTVVAAEDAVSCAAAAFASAREAARRAAACRVAKPKLKRNARADEAAKSRAYRLGKLADAALSRAVAEADGAERALQDVRHRRKLLLAELERHRDSASARVLDEATERVRRLDDRLLAAKRERDDDLRRREDHLADAALEACCGTLVDEAILAACRVAKQGLDRDRRRAAKAARAALDAAAADRAADVDFFFHDDDGGDASLSSTDEDS